MRSTILAAISAALAGHSLDALAGPDPFLAPFAKRPGIPDNVAFAKVKRWGLNLWPQHKVDNFMWGREVGPRASDKPKLVPMRTEPASQALTRQCRRQDERKAAKGRPSYKRHKTGVQRVYQAI